MPGAIGTALAFAASNGAALLGASVATQAVIAAGAAALGGTVLGLGLTLVSNFLLRGRVQTPSPSDGQTAIKQALAPRVKYYGKVRVSGTVWWVDAISRVLYLGVAINHGRISSFVDWFIDSNPVDIDGADKVTTSPYSAHDVYLHHRFGAASETKYSELLTDFGADEMRGDGVATVLGTFENPAGAGSAAEFQNSYPDVPPTIRTTIEASVVWDPRDSAQDREDESTWEWSENPVVCLLNYLLSADGYGIPWERIEDNLAQWIEAADICDEDVDLLGGGTTARYRIAFGYRLTDDPRDVVAKFCSVMDARVWTRRDGSIGISVGRFAAPEVTIENGQVLAYDLTRGQDPVHAIQGVRAEFMSPDHDYREHEAEPWPTGAAVLELSEDRTTALDLLAVPSLSQARRLMKRAYIRATANWRGTVVVNLAGLRLVDERYGRFRIDELGIDDTFEIGSCSVDFAAGTVEVDILSVDATIDDWDAEAEEGESEAGGFAWLDSFSKSGTTLDPISELGGAAGQTAIVYCASTVGIAATPAGWTLIAKAGPTSGLAVGGFFKVLDGSETATAFNTTSGIILAALLSGAPSPSAGADANATVSTSTITGLTAVVATPFAIFAFGAANANFDPTDYVDIQDGASKSVIAEEHFERLQTATISAELKAIFYGSDEVPPASFSPVHNADHGTNGLVSNTLAPGS